MSGKLRIGLLMSWNLAYCRRAMQGISAVAREQTDWLLIPIEAQRSLPSMLRRLKLSAVLAHVHAPSTASDLRRWNRPVINTSGILSDSGLRRVGIDDDAVGRAAARHLVERGFRHFAFVGHARHAYSVTREAGFRDGLPHGQKVAAFHRRGRNDEFHPQGGAWALDASLIAWLRTLPKPVGVFACNDIWGVQLAESCRQAGLRVPQDVAIVGVDNDDLLCTIARPTLSSVSLPHEQIGRRAAETLAAWLATGRPPSQPVLFAPTGVTTRQSTDRYVSSSPDGSAAIEVIRQRSRPSIGVADLLRDVPTSRRTLERIFRRDFGAGIHAQIRRARVERAQQLLATTTLAMPQIARRSGFSSAQQLSKAFRSALNCTPTSYRRATKVGDEPR